MQGVGRIHCSGRTASSFRSDWAADRNVVVDVVRLGHDRAVVLDWSYFRQLYEGLHEQP